jgi:predicted nucleotidyltransferase
MTTSIILGVSLAISVAANIVLVRLASWQSRDLANISDNLGDLIEIIESYRNHLKKVYELDAFYGDATLEGLMQHTNAIRVLLEEQYGEVVSITDPIEYETQEEQDGEEESSEKEKHVLYAGTRKRDN